jgi:hypothetical protein
MMLGVPDDRITVEDVQNIRDAVDEALRLCVKAYGTKQQQADYADDTPKLTDPVGTHAIRQRLSKASYTADKIERRLSI